MKKSDIADLPRSSRTPDLTGRRFGTLSVIRFVGYHYPRHYDRRSPVWECLCDCGRSCLLAAKTLTRDGSVHCACVSPSGFTTHGHASRSSPDGRVTKEYRTWRGIINRCTNPRIPIYAYYGARGITVCERWHHSFEAFLADMGPAPSPEHSVEREDNDGPYSPENCHWATRAEQVTNKRNTQAITFNDETLTVAEWSRRTGIGAPALYNRLHAGWSPEEILTTPTRDGNRWREKWKAEGKI